MIVVNESPDRLARQWPRLFDAVLVDAPCSGEGMFRRHPETVVEWTEDSPVLCAKRQQGILEQAARLIRPGGRLCYSTCTFNTLENEEQIRSFLTAHPEFEPADFSLPRIGSSRDGTLRIWPHRTAGEGHFIALLHRRNDEEESAPAEAPRNGGLADLDRTDRKTAEDLLGDLLSGPFHADAEFSGGLWQLPVLTPDLRGLRLLRPGVRLLRRQQRLLLPEELLRSLRGKRRPHEKERAGERDEQDREESAPHAAPDQLMFPTVRGNASTSRMLLIPVRYMMRRSKPRPKPACRTLP